MRKSKKAIAINSLNTLTLHLRPVSKPVHGWIRAVRDALGLSRSALASRLSVSAPAVQDYEKNEAHDRITLATLRRAAAALDCEVVVAFIPRDGKTFTELAAENDPEIAHLRATEHSMALEAQASGDLDEETTRRLQQ